MAQANWPSIALPNNVSAFNMGEQVTINGLPMRARGFVSSASPAQLADWFRQRLGKPLMENSLGAKQILGRAQGEYYLTVQLEPVGVGGRSGTRGIVAVTNLKAAYEHRDDTQAMAERWLSRLPADSKLLSQMASEDGGKRSQHLVITNGQGEELNRDRLKYLLQEDGFIFEREAVAGEKTAAHLPAHLANGKTLYFKSPGKEAIAVISHNANGDTAIVLNTITALERFK